MQPLLEPFEPASTTRSLPLLPIGLALVTVVALVWLVWLASTFEQHRFVAPATEQPVATASAESPARLPSRQRNTEAPKAVEPLPQHLPLPAPLITVAPKTEVTRISISGASAWQQPQTIDGSYYGQVDPETGLPKTIYLSEHRKYVVDSAIAARPGAPKRTATTGVQVHAPASSIPPSVGEAAADTPSVPTYFDFDSHVRKRGQN